MYIYKFTTKGLM